MTDNNVLATLERLLGEATPGPWEHHTLAVTNGRETILQTGISNSFRPPRPRECEANAALIVLIRNAAPALVEVAKAARRQYQVRVDWAGVDETLAADEQMKAALRALDKVTL
jgi:hypothetical protein